MTPKVSHSQRLPKAWGKSQRSCDRFLS